MNARITGNQMNLKHFHDFYYLETLLAGITMAKSAKPELQFSHSVERLENDVREAFEYLSANMAKRVFVYIWAAALGEVRHAYNMVPLSIREIRGSNWSRETVYANTTEFEPTAEHMEAVRSVYDQKEWGGSFGGKAWLNVVEGMMLYGKVNNATFIDHAVDLEHNGGNIFNKNAHHVGMEVYADFYDSTKLRRFLNYKFRFDILEHYTGSIEVSSKVYRLVTRYSNIIRKVAAVDFLVPSLEWLTDYEVNWGTKTISTTGDAGISYSSDEEPRERYDAQCELCSHGIYASDHRHWNGSCVCRRCYARKMDNQVTCEHCNRSVDRRDTMYVDGENATYCNACVSNYVVTCEDCNHEYHVNGMNVSEDGHDLCNDCYNENKCEACGECHYEDMDEHDENTHSEEAELARKQAETQKREGVSQLPLPLYNPVGYEVVYQWSDGSKVLTDPATFKTHCDAQEQVEIYKLAGAYYTKIQEVK